MPKGFTKKGKNRDWRHP